jgi:hypothetical protein
LTIGAFCVGILRKKIRGAWGKYPVIPPLLRHYIDRYLGVFWDFSLKKPYQIE